MPLRSDLLTVFSEKVFALVPKRDPANHPSGVSLVVHVVNPHHDMAFQTHIQNRRVTAPNCRTELLFARFAWTVFSPGLLRPFLDRCVTNRLLLVHDKETGELTVETRNPEQARAILAAGMRPCCHGGNPELARAVLDAAVQPCGGNPEQAPAVLAVEVRSARRNSVGGEKGGGEREGEGEGEGEYEGDVEDEGDLEDEGEDEREDEGEDEREETPWRGRLRKRPRIESIEL